MSAYYTANVQSPIIQGLYNWKCCNCSVIYSKFLQLKLISYQDLTPLTESFKKGLKVCDMSKICDRAYLYNFLVFNCHPTDDNKYLASHFSLFNMKRKSQALILILAIILAVWQRSRKWDTLGLSFHTCKVGYSRNLLIPKLNKQFQ